jgi:hypothetical protein
MSNQLLEERVAAVEKGLEEVRREISRLETQAKDNWLDSLLGRFKDNPYYDEVVRLGKEFREAGGSLDDPSDAEVAERP